MIFCLLTLPYCTTAQKWVDVVRLQKAHCLQKVGCRRLMVEVSLCLVHIVFLVSLAQAAPNSSTHNRLQVATANGICCRAAYESRAARVAIVRECNAKKERRREMRAMGSAERAVLLAEHGVPLGPNVHVKRSR